MKNLLCLIGLHKWSYEGEPSLPGAKRTCRRKDCKTAEKHFKTKYEVFSPPEKWVKIN